MHSPTAADSTYPADLDFDTFRESVSRSVVMLELNSADRDAFRGHLDAAVAGDIHVLDVGASAHAVSRTPGIIARTAQPYYKFTVIEHGCGLIIQDGRETTLSTGDMAIYDTQRPYSLIFEDAVRMSTVMFPKDMLAIPLDVLQRLTAVRLSSSSGAGALLRPYLGVLAGQMSELDRRSAHRLFRTAIDMVGTLIESRLGDDATPNSHETLTRKILGYIDEHLGDAELDPARIAAAHFISVRHLHGLFKESGMTVSSAIRIRRLERCYDQLINPLLAETPIAAIAFSNGFVESTHFSRSFRTHFGVSPSSLRSSH